MRGRRTTLALLLVGGLVVVASQAAGGGSPLDVEPGPAAGSPPLGVAPTGTASTEGLTPALARAVRRASAAAAEQGVEVRVTSGHRTRAHQSRLFRDAVRKYGSERAASAWVLPPGQSEHERGRAVDIGPESGAAWLDEHGVRYGLCRRYDNEPWHFELLAPARGQRCPAQEPQAVAR